MDLRVGPIQSWVPKNDAFELWCWRRLLRVPWTARRSNQSILKEISPEYSLEGLMLKLKLQYFDDLMQRTDSLEKTLMLKDWRWEEKGWQRDKMVGITDSLDMSLSKLQKSVMDREPGMLQSMGSPRVRHDWATELNWMYIQKSGFFGGPILRLYLLMRGVQVWSLIGRGKIPYALGPKKPKT